MRLLVLAALSGQHLLLLGPPGTAKSALARRLAAVVDASGADGGPSDGSPSDCGPSDGDPDGSGTGGGGGGGGAAVGSGAAAAAAGVIDPLGVYFERTLTRFTTPEELFGPLSLRALEDDR